MALSYNRTYVENQSTGKALEGVVVRVYFNGVLQSVFADESSTPLPTVLTGADGSATYFVDGDGVYEEEYIYNGDILDRVKVPIFNPANYVPVSGFGAFGSTLVANATAADARADLAINSAAEIAASGGSALVGFLQSGTGAVATTVDAFLKQTPTDLGFATLQEAVTAAAGKTILVNRAWTLTSAVSIPANTTVVVNGTITQSTNATSIFTIAADNVTITGRGLMTGTNTETATTCAIEATNSDNFVVDGIVLKNARYGVALLGGCTNYRIERSIFYGGVAETGGGNSSDIFAYGTSGNLNNRGLINGNFCLGNNDVGINFNANNGDDEFIISNNFVVPCDADGLVKRSEATTTRRFGIIAAYVGGTDGRRQVIGNTVWGTAYAGFYSIINTPPAGHTVWSDNVAIGCGFGTSLFDGTDASLRSGFMFVGGSYTSGSGNKAIGCYTSGLKIVGQTLYSAANGQRVSFDGFTIFGTLDPTITAAAARAVFITGTPNNIYLGGLDIVHSGTYAAVYYDTTDIDCGGVVFDGGRISTFGAAGAFQIINATGGTDATQPVTVQGVEIIGNDNTTNSAFNSGVYKEGNVIVRNNTIQKYHRGLNDGDANNVRRIDRIVDGNVFVNCAFGLNGGGTGAVLAQNNRYLNCTTRTNGAYIEGKLIDTVIHFQSAGIPTSGAFAIGDVAFNTSVAAGVAKAWGRATTGSGHVLATDWLSWGNY